MPRKMMRQAICLKEYITEKEHIEINQLEKICRVSDKVNLKLELDYKYNLYKKSIGSSNNINEFLYYANGILVSYLGISSFGGNIGEINGMTHPKWRNKGLFKKLLNIAIVECNNRNYNKILLLADDKSNSGKEFIKFVGGTYDFSEYRMKLIKKTSLESIDIISLRKAGKIDGKEIGRQNTLFFNDVEDGESLPEQEENLNEVTYMIELEGQSIGKINVEYNDKSAFIYGFGILPDFRGKGYGKVALRKALSLINEKNIYEIELDVECKNNTALNLYKDCGFEEKSIMNYYKYNPGL